MIVNEETDRWMDERANAKPPFSATVRRGSANSPMAGPRGQEPRPPLTAPAEFCADGERVQSPPQGAHALGSSDPRLSRPNGRHAEQSLPHQTQHRFQIYAR